MARILGDGRLTHADGVGGVQLAAVRALAVEGPGHVAAHAVDARVGEALVDVWNTCKGQRSEARARFRQMSQSTSG